MRVTRLSRIFSTIFSRSAITGRSENLEDENADECTELHEDVGDDGDAILKPLLFSLSAQRKAETIGIYRNDSMSSLFSEKAKAVVAGSLPPGRLGAPYGSKNRRR